MLSNEYTIWILEFVDVINPCKTLSENVAILAEEFSVQGLAFNRIELRKELKRFLKDTKGYSDSILGKLMEDKDVI